MAEHAKKSKAQNWVLNNSATLSPNYDLAQFKRGNAVGDHATHAFKRYLQVMF